MGCICERGDNILESTIVDDNIEEIKLEIDNRCHGIKTNTDKLSNLIATNEKTEQFAYDYIKQLALEELSIDGDEKIIENKEDQVAEKKPFFDTTTLEKRLPNFDKLVYTPSNVFELIDKMQDAVNNGISIKAMGSRYAMSEITFTDGLLIDMFNGLNNANMNINSNTLNEYGIKIYENRNLHITQSGASVESIINSLWPENDRYSLINKQTKQTYKTLQDVPGSALCFGGIINSGSSGEGTPFINKNEKLNHGSYSNQILAYSMIIVDENEKVRLVQIEPDTNNGAIHDEKKWMETFPDIILIQNDDVFEAGLVSMGLLGVIYSYYILLEDAYFVEEKTKLITYDTFKNTEWNNMKTKILENEIESLEILLSPYTSSGFFSEFDESPPLLIQTYSKTDKIPKKENGVNMDSIPSELFKIAAIINIYITRTIPEMIPFIIRMTLKLLTATSNGIVRPSVDYGSVGSAVVVPTKTNAFAFNYNDIIFFNFLDDYVKLMNEFRNKDRNQVNPLPLSIRFSSYKSKGLLNMFNNDNNENGYFWFEFVLPNFEKQFDETVTAIIENRDEMFDKIQKLSMNKPYFGNPHWGLYISLKDKNENIFRNINKDKLNKFINIYKKYNKTKTFSNKFTKESGLDNMAQL